MDLTIGRSIAPAKYNEHGTTIKQSVINDIILAKFFMATARVCSKSAEMDGITFKRQQPSGDRFFSG
ncbi:hypothetical protein RBWH47_00785 [Rhodopirellula baltica WH47]|uniref:Uncharacterized protein n=1 Tax=Rhodopirellula baltica WH47 TaxID=991778 RepID=F2B096_RHOBT|nr:hypothetical protein RBWH47_00785 [Rhodopirellula baltica WH47]